MANRQRVTYAGALALIVTGIGALAAIAPHYTSAQSGCSPQFLGRALRLDSLQLVRDTVYEGPVHESTEGAVVERFRDGKEIRLLRVTYFGETGRAIDSYYLLSPTEYVVEHTQLFYSRPITLGDVKIGSVFRQYFYFCGGSLVDFGYSTRAETLARALRELLQD